MILFFHGLLAHNTKKKFIKYIIRHLASIYDQSAYSLILNLFNTPDIFVERLRLFNANSLLAEEEETWIEIDITWL